MGVVACVCVCVRVCMFMCWGVCWLGAAEMQSVAGISKDSQADISIDFDVDNPSHVPESQLIFCV